MKRYLTVGPTQLHPKVKEFTNEAIEKGILSISHRSKTFEEICRFTNDCLRELLDIPDTHSILYLSSATECMERLIQGTVAEKSFHFVNGYFAQRFLDIANQLGKKPDAVTVEYGESFDFENIIIPENCEAICITQNETSTGVAISPAKIEKLKEKYPEKFLIIDAVTGLPFTDFNYSKSDAVFFSVQKGFSLPAGLGVIIVKNDLRQRASELQSHGYVIGSYNSLTSLFDNADKGQTTITPNMLGIFLLGKVCEQFLKYGVEKIRTDTISKAGMLYDLKESEFIKCFVRKKNDRSKTTIAFETPDGNNEIMKAFDDEGLRVSSGYKDFRKSQIRIANFPVQTFEDIEKAVKVINSFHY